MNKVHYKVQLWQTILLLCLVFLFQNAFAQTNKKVVKLCDAAGELIAKQDYAKAKNTLNKVFAIDTTYARAYILRGDVYSLTLDAENAAKDYNTAIVLMRTPKPILYFIAAEEELKCGHYQEAKSHYEEFLAKSPDKVSLAKNIDKGLKICEFSIEAIKHPVSFDPINLGANINSEWDEYLPTLTADEEEFIFTVRRPRDEKTICNFCQTEEDFYSSVKENGEWQPRKALGAPINSSYNEGAQCISPDGHYLFYTLCNTDIGIGSCDLYWAKRIGDRWSRPKNFDPPVNTKYWESQPAIAPDGKTIYFASNRPGGLGGIDIWKTEMIEEGVFTVPENLGAPINSEGDETAPFIHADGKTLFFVSDGHPGLGGKDIFYAIMDADGKWQNPVNLGYPINTPNDEINIVINATGTTGYFSSDKDGGFGGQDLYVFTLDERIRPTPVTYIKGKVQDEYSLQPLHTQIELIDLKTNQTVTSTTSDPITGEYLACVPTGSNILMNVVHPHYPFYSENFNLKKSYTELDPFIKDIFLKKAEIGKTFILKNIFFDFDKSTLVKESYVELDNLVSYLKANKSLKIEIGGHTDDQGSEEYNEKLSLSRAESVYKYLISKGIESNRLTYKGYGESMPIDDNSTEKGRAANRRTEFKITGYEEE
ncbi:MAG: OmpA family protein [Bacteroidales bacterium]|nr:OmpA family protein [Bacteroidales bacterium]